MSEHSDLRSYISEYNRFSSARDFSEALRVAQEAVSIFPDNVPLKIRLAVALLKNNDAEGSKKCLDEVLVEDQNNTWALDIYCEAALLSGDFDEVAIKAERLCLCSENVAGLTKLAKLYLITGQFDDLHSTLYELRYLGAKESIVADFAEKAKAKVGVQSARKELSCTINSGKFGDKFVSRAKLNGFLANKIQDEHSFFLGRSGRVEGLVTQYCLFDHECISFEKMKWAQLHAGITPIDADAFRMFSVIYLESIRAMDLVGLVPFEGQLSLIDGFRNKNFTMNSWFNPFRSIIDNIVDLDSERHWLQALEDKTVLVVHPFAQSISMQYLKKNYIKTVNKILPDFDLITIKPPQTSAGEHGNKSWLIEFEYLKSAVQAKKFDVALVGAGGYGLPLGAYIKNELGKSALVLGGDVQVIFGVLGKRWEKTLFENGLIDDSWVKPTAEETPVMGFKIEGGCYW